MTNRSTLSGAVALAAFCASLAGAMLVPSHPASAQQAKAHPAAAYQPLGQEGSSSWTPVTNTWNLAFVGGTPIQRVRTSWAGYDPHRRAMMVQDRVNHALSVGPVRPREFTVGRIQGDWCVLFRGHRFLTADARSAHLNHSNPRRLAMRWAHRMRLVFPALTRPTG